MEVYLGLGSNEGCREEHIETAIVALENAFDAPCLRISSLIETKAWGFESAKDFLNSVVVFDVDLEHFRKEYAPAEDNPDMEQTAGLILRICKSVEKMCGRRRNSHIDENGRKIYHDRPMDVDILFMGTEEIDNEELTIPHIEMNIRDFVMIPLREVVSEEIKTKFPDIFETE